MELVDLSAAFFSATRAVEASRAAEDDGHPQADANCSSRLPPTVLSCGWRATLLARKTCSMSTHCYVSSSSCFYEAESFCTEISPRERGPPFEGSSLKDLCSCCFFFFSLPSIFSAIIHLNFCLGGWAKSSIECVHADRTRHRDAAKLIFHTRFRSTALPTRTAAGICMRPVVPRVLRRRERTEQEKVCGAHVRPVLVGHRAGSKKWAEVEPKGESSRVEEGRSCCRIRRIGEENG